jgi:hypothetical protein
MTHSRAQIINLPEDPCRDRLKTHRAHLGQVAFARDGKADWPSVLPLDPAGQARHGA